MIQIAIIGVGNMGGGMAMRLLDRGYVVHVIDIDAAKTEALAAQGAIVHSDVSTLPDACLVVIVCVVDNSQVGLVIPTISTSSSGNRTVMLCPTIAPEDTERFAASLTSRGLQAIDAPMSGGPARAKHGTMLDGGLFATTRAIHDPFS